MRQAAGVPVVFARARLHDAGMYQAESPFRSSRAIAVFLPLSILALFLFKPFHMDDPIFLWTAQNILGLHRAPSAEVVARAGGGDAPPPVPCVLGFSLDFYGFEVNWYRTVQPMWEVNQNPPLLAYYLALWGRFAGFSEVAMHAAMLLPTAWCIAGIFCLARRFTKKPLAATLCATLNPLFLVSASTVMCDAPMLAFYVWCIEYWGRGLDSRRMRPYLLSALCVGFGILTKYFAITAIPLLVFWSLARFCQWRTSRRGGNAANRDATSSSAAKSPAHLSALLPLLFLLIPLIMLTAYEAWCTHRYGRGLFLDAIRYAADLRSSDDPRWLGRGVSVLTFLGAGSLAAVSLVIARLLRWQWFLAGMAGGAAGAIVHDAGRASGWMLSAQVFFWVVVGVLLLVVASQFLVRLLQDGLRGESKQLDALPLLLLLAGTLLFAMAFNHFVNARILLTAMIAGCLLCFVDVPDAPPGTRRAGVWLAVLPTAFLSMLALTADHAQAAGAAAASAWVQDIVHAGGEEGREKKARVWFTGHWGFQYYMEKIGAYPLDVARLKVRPGDFIVAPNNNTNLIALKLPGDAKKENFSADTLPFLATQNKAVGAGFYSDIFGPLPFAFGEVPADRYWVRCVPEPQGQGE